MKEILKRLWGSKGSPKSCPEIVIVHGSKENRMFLCTSEADVKDAINEGLKGTPKRQAIHIERHSLV